MSAFSRNRCRMLERARGSSSTPVRRILGGAAWNSSGLLWNRESDLDALLTVFGYRVCRLRRRAFADASAHWRCYAGTPLLQSLVRRCTRSVSGSRVADGAEPQQAPPLASRSHVSIAFSPWAADETRHADRTNSLGTLILSRRRSQSGSSGSEIGFGIPFPRQGHFLVAESLSTRRSRSLSPAIMLNRHRCASSRTVRQWR